MKASWKEDEQFCFDFILSKFSRSHKNKFSHLNDNLMVLAAFPPILNHTMTLSKWA
jgi:hypothetical protein